MQLLSNRHRLCHGTGTDVLSVAYETAAAFDNSHDLTNEIHSEVPDTQ